MSNHQENNPPLKKVPTVLTYLENRTLTFFAILFITGLAYSVLNTSLISSEVPYDAELRFADFSPLGSSGGSVVPASCDSGYEHVAGDLDACPNPPNLRFICDPRGISARVLWDPPPGATAYHPRLSGNGGNCPAPWSVRTSGLGCLVNDWTSTEFTLPVIPNSPHVAWLHTTYGGDPHWNRSVEINFSCPTIPPKGVHDSATCNLDAGTLTGWLCDADDYNVSLDYHVYRGGPAGSGVWVGSGNASVYRADVAADPGACGGTGNHGFEFSIPWDLRQSGANHTYYIHAIDYSPYGFSGNPLLTNTPKSVTCPLPPPPTKIDDGLCEYDFIDNRLEGTFRWDAPAGPDFYDTYYVRADRTAVGRWPSDWNDENFVGTNYEITGLTGGSTYYWWVHTKYTPTGGWSNYIEGQFTCPLPPEVTVEARAESPTTGSGPWTAGSLLLQPGENVTLQWSTQRATTCDVIAGPGLSVGGATAGTDAVDRPNPGDTHNYHIRCRGPGGYGDGYIAISTDVIPVTATLNATPSIVPQGETTDLDWAITTTYPLLCTVTGGGTNRSLPRVNAPGDSDRVTTAPVPNTTNYLLSCLPEGYTGPTYTANARVEVIPRSEER